MRIPNLTAWSTLLICLPFQAQSKPHRNDLFAKYPVSTSYAGPLAKPKLTTSDERAFRTMIRRGARRGPVFAGHYAVASWGCGTTCTSFAIIDCITGSVYEFPFTVSGFDMADEGIDYRRNSRAIHIVGDLNEKDGADRWYLWTGKELVLLFQNPTRPDVALAP